MEKRLQMQMHWALKVLRKYHGQRISNVLITEEMGNYLEKKKSCVCVCACMCFKEVACVC